METTKKLKLLTYAIIFLLALNLATISTIIYHIYNDKKQQKKQEQKYYPKHGYAVAFAKITNELDLTPQQRQLFHQYFLQYRQTTQKILDSLRNTRIAINREVKKNHPDTLKIKQLAKKVGHYHTLLSYNQAAFYIKLAKHLKPAQRRKLYQIYIKYQRIPGWRRFKKSKNQKL